MAEPTQTPTPEVVEVLPEATPAEPTPETPPAPEVLEAGGELSKAAETIQETMTNLKELEVKGLADALTGLTRAAEVLTEIAEEFRDSLDRVETLQAQLETALAEAEEQTIQAAEAKAQADFQTQAATEVIQDLAKPKKQAFLGIFK